MFSENLFVIHTADIYKIRPRLGKYTVDLGADHLTFEGVGGGGGGWMISGQQEFFSSNLLGRKFFSLLNALQDIFSHHISLQDFFLFIFYIFYSLYFRGASTR